MIKFKLLGAFAFLSMLGMAQPPAFGSEGRQIAAPPWSAACMTVRATAANPCGSMAPLSRMLDTDILALRLTSREARDE